MNDDLQPEGTEGGEVLMFGNPWHGRVKGGVLYTGKLDAGSSEITRSWPQPPNAFIWLAEPDGQPADAYTAPGVPGAAPQSVYNTLKAEHAAAGKEFKPWALISGGQVYGQQLGVNKWFYFSGDRVYLVTLTYPDTVTNTGSLAVQLSAQLWPEFSAGAHSAAITKSFTLSDIGQSTPDLSTLGIAATLNVSLHDVKKDGSACILSLHTTSAVDGTVPPALGFVLINLSSDVDWVFDAVTASVLKTREQTLGVVTANRNFTTFDCSFVPVADGKCLGPSYSGQDGGVELIISDRLVTAFFDEASGVIAYSSIDYESISRKQTQTQVTYTVTSIVGGTVYWTYFENSSPQEVIERRTYKVGAATHSITDDYSLFGGYSEMTTDSSADVSSLSNCGYFTCPIVPGDTPYKTDAEILKIRLTAEITLFPCYYANVYTPVVLVKNSLIGTPKGITAISDAWLDAFESGLSTQQALLYVAYHPKTGEVVPFLANLVSFV
ncbi:MAG: hypothetical protein ABS92_06815 [Thiobacillus sp. SCN 63-374]|nr:MAG: hypothetical protein ABS92_06815 [Thiobacillus sp. SCN 63-374]